MTEALASKTCTPCRGGIPPLTREQAELFHGQAPDRQLVEEAHRIERSLGHSLSSLPRRVSRCLDCTDWPTASMIASAF